MRLWPLLGLVAALLAGCGGSEGGDAAPTRSDAAARRATPTASPAPRPLPGVPDAARRQAAEMSVEQRVAQVLVVGVEVPAPARGWGGVSGDPAITAEARFAAEQAGLSPPLVMGSSPQPGVTLAPVVTDIGDAAGPMAQRALSADPARVAKLARREVGRLLAAGVLPAPAHFPGQGAASQDPLDGPASVGLTREQLEQRDLPAFEAALERAPAVVVSSAAFTAFDPVTPAVLVPGVVRDLLRRELRFAGAVMTDDLGGIAAATGGTQADAAVRALRAGADLVQVPDASEVEGVYRGVLEAVRSERLAPARLRDAAAHVIELKRRAALAAAPTAPAAPPAPSPG